MNPVAVGVEFGFGERFVEGNVVELAEGASFFPGVAFDFETFERAGEREVAEEGVSEFVEEEEAEVFVGLEVDDSFGRTKEEFAAGFEGELGVGGFEGVEEGEVFVGEWRGGFGWARRSFLVADVVGEDGGGHGNYFW